MATETLRLILDATNKGLVAGMKEGEAATASLGTKTTLLQGALGKMGIQAGNTGSLMAAGLAGGAVVAGLAIGKMALDGIDKFEKLTGEVRAFQRVSGATAETSSALLFTMKRLGIDPDAAAASVGRLSQRLGTGTVDLAKFGVEVVKSKDGTIDLSGTLGNIAEKMSALGPGTEQAKLGFAAFGKGWQTLLPYLSKGKDELAAIADIAKKQGLIFDQQDLNTGRDLTLATRDLKSAWVGLEITLAEGIAPTLVTILKTTTDIIGKIKDIAGAGGERKIGKGLFGGWEDIAGGGNAVKTFATSQDEANKAVAKVADLAAAGKRGTQEYKDAVLAAAKANASLDETQTEVNNSLQTTVDKAFAATNAVLGLWNADLAAANAAANVTEKQNAYAAALEEKGVGAAFKAAQAEREYESAVLQSVAANAAAAVQKLGPGADAQAKEKASTEATIASLEYYASVTSGPVHAAIVEHLRQLGLVPSQKGTWISVETAEAEASIARFVSGLRTALNNVRWSIPPATNSGTWQGGAIRLPGFASGGTVPGPTGQARLAIVHGGERITPAGQSWAGGTIIVQNYIAGSVVTEKQLTRLVAENLRSLRSRSGNQEL